MSNELLAATAGSYDVSERALRPQTLSAYTGQAAVVEQLSIFIEAARQRQESLDHVLIFGPPGLGKTTLANIIANELQVNCKQTSGPVLDKPGDVAALLTNLQARDVLFIDEIHRLSPVIEEILYPAMEDYHIDIVLGEGPAARSLKLNLPEFTLVGATTRAGLLTSPLRDRFGIIAHLEFYSLPDLTEIIMRSAQLLDLPLDYASAYVLAQRARGTPRIANRLLRRVRDFVQVKYAGTITPAIVQEALDLLKVDNQGLDRIDRKLLTALINNFNGGPAGIDSLAAFINEERTTLEDVVEPFLLQLGFIVRTPRGRIATALAYQHFNWAVPEHILLNNTNEQDVTDTKMTT